MYNLLGEFECSIDEKSRLRVPSALLKQLGDTASLGFVLNRGFNKNLVLFPKDVWQQQSDEIRKLNLFVRENQQFVHYFFRGASELKLDASERVLMPKSLLEHIGLPKDVTLFAYFDRIEIWPKESYDAMLDNEPSSFADLAERVMGKIHNS